MSTPYVTCHCGSGLPPHGLYDARGIYVARVCDKCETEIKAKYRQDIFDDPNYECDEQIEPDE